MSVRRRWVRSGAAAIAVVVVLALAWPAAAAAPAARVTIDGRYRIVSTDCFFPAGACREIMDILQHGDHLSSPTDPELHGRVSGHHVRIREIVECCNEDDWWLSGTASDGGRTVRGTMSDGIGGTGTFRMTYLGP